MYRLQERVGEGRGRMRFIESSKERRQTMKWEKVVEKATGRHEDVRMRFSAQLLFNLLRKAKLFSGGELYPVL